MKKWENLEDTGKNIVMIFIFGMVMLTIVIVIAVGISALLTGDWSTAVESAEPNLVETHKNPAPTEAANIISGNQPKEIYDPYYF